MSKSLQIIQGHFQDYVLAPRNDTPAIAQSIEQRFGLRAGERLAIYHNAYRARLHEALSEAFEKTHIYLGDDLFGEMSGEFVQAHPSQVRNLRWYGDGFPAFLADRLHEHPVAAELARFEWALGLAFDAEDAPLLAADDMRSLTSEQWETLGFSLHPSLQMLPLYWNAVAIWLALDQQHEPPEPVTAETAEHWLIWRKALQPHFRSLDAYEMLALTSLQDGRSFSETCAAATHAAGGQDITPKIAGWLQAWMNDAVLSAIK